MAFYLQFISSHFVHFLSNHKLCPIEYKKVKDSIPKQGGSPRSWNRTYQKPSIRLFQFK